MKALCVIIVIPAKAEIHSMSIEDRFPLESIPQHHAE